jgi:hypothetical protein
LCPRETLDILRREKSLPLSGFKPQIIQPANKSLYRLCHLSSPFINFRHISHSVPMATNTCFLNMKHLLLFYCNNGGTNEPQCDITGTMPALFILRLVTRQPHLSNDYYISRVITRFRIQFQPMPLLKRSVLKLYLRQQTKSVSISRSRHLLNCEKGLLASSCLSLCPSVHMEQLGFQWNDIHEIWYLSIFKKSVHISQVSLKVVK